MSIFYLFLVLLLISIILQTHTFYFLIYVVQFARECIIEFVCLILILDQTVLSSCFNKVVSEPWLVSLSMVNARIEVWRFGGKKDFSLWKTRMLPHLSVLDLKDILEESLSPYASAIRNDEDEDVYIERLLKEKALRR